jgi:hypothetical protein
MSRHEHITHIGNMAGKWQMTREEAIRRIDAKTEAFYTIDLNTKVVSGAGHKTNQDTPGCKMNPDDRPTWTYQLVKGFDVYWALRSKARPLPVRIIQSLFGN